MVTYNEAEARRIDRAYLTPDITRQRMRTLEALQLAPGESVLDVGCGTGLLAEQMAALVGASGRVAGVDASADMLARARRRCADLPQVDFAEAGAEALPEGDARFDAAVCTQVLLYVPEVAAALAEMHRVLKPGGRVVIIETDWRGTVLGSADDALTRRVLAGWDAAVPSPNLPVRLIPLLRDQGFAAVRVEAFPIVNTGRAGTISEDMFVQLAEYAVERGAVTAEEVAGWLDDLARRDAEGSYFFCVNRFIFSAVRL